MSAVRSLRAVGRILGGDLGIEIGPCERLDPPVFGVDPQVAPADVTALVPTQFKLDVEIEPVPEIGFDRVHGNDVIGGNPDRSQAGIGVFIPGLGRIPQHPIRRRSRRGSYAPGSSAPLQTKPGPGSPRR